MMMRALTGRGKCMRPHRSTMYVLVFALGAIAACGRGEDLPYRFDEKLGEAKSVRSEDPAIAGAGFSFHFDDPGESLWKPLSGVRSLGCEDGLLRMEVSPGAVLESPEGVSFRAPEISEIALRMRVRRGGSFSLSWGNDPRRTTRVRLESDRGFHTYSIDTSTLRRWNGRIDRIVLRPSDSSDVDFVEVDFIEFKTDSPFSLAAAGMARHKINRERRNVLFVHSPSELVFEKRITSGMFLDVGMGILSGNSPTEFTVAISEREEETIVLSQIVSQANRWRDASLDLSGWEGKTVDVVFRTDSAVKGATSLWSNPVVYEADPERKNIVVYLIDALRSDHLSCYGYHRNTSPNIDAFAEGGILCTNSYSHAARTVESIPTIMTSTYTSTHNVIDYTCQLDEEFITIAEAMRDAGYATASFITNPNAGEMTNVDQGFDFLIDRAPGHMYRPGLWTLPKEEVKSWIESQRNRPFFAYIHTCEPHAPFVPPPPWNTQFDPDYTGSVTGLRSGTNGYLNAEDPADIAHVVALYDGEVSLADQKFGEFLGILESEGLLDNSMVILIADHGEELMDHGDWNHSKTLYEELVRVPIIVGGDSRLPRTSLTSPRVGLVDVMPTVLGWAGVTLPADVQGLNLLEIAAGNSAAGERSIFAENYNPSYESVALIEGDHKLIYEFPPHKEPEVELYDLAEDPEETSDISDQGDVAGRLLEQLLAIKAEKQNLSKGEAPKRELDEQSREKLRALGYID